MTRPLVIFSTQGWTDLWVSKHWIANEFSKDRLVLFVEPPVRTAPGKLMSGELFEGKMTKINNHLFTLKTETFPFPFRVPSVFRFIWRLPIASQFDKAVRALDISDFDVLNFDPHSLSLIEKYKESVKNNVYYAVDPPLGKEDSIWSESKCVKESDFVFSVTPTLKDLLVKESGREDVEILPHGVDYHGSQASGGSLPESLKSEFDKIPDDKVVIGYTGAIHDVCIDQDIILEAVRRKPNWTFVFVGPYRGSTLSKKGLDVSAFKKFHNVFFTGSVPYVDLKYVIKRFDVCIVPYNHKADVGWERRSPFKVLGYLAQGKPVVISNVPAVVNYGEHVYIYDNLDEFLVSCEAALKSFGKEKGRQDFAAKHDFSILKDRLVAKLN